MKPERAQSMAKELLSKLEGIDFYNFATREDEAIELLKSTILQATAEERERAASIAERIHFVSGDVVAEAIRRGDEA